MKLRLTSLVVVASVLFASVDANASVVTSIPGGSVLPFPTVKLITAGPETIAPGVTWSSTFSASAYGWINGYNFHSNGIWAGPPPMIGLDSGFGSMTFAFSTSVSAVGGEINWLCCDGIGNSNAVISVYDSTHALIESYTLATSGTSNIATPNSFYGFSENSADISYFTLSGDFIGIRNELTTLTGPVPSVPLPATLPLFATGLVGLGLLGWRRKKKALGA
jgi:hypothetical protein